MTTSLYGLTTQLTTSLHNRNFRLYFGGMCISLTGTWMQQVAMSWLVYRLTGSVLLLAGTAFMSQIPVLLLTPFMSVWTDRTDRRKILFFTQSLSALQALALGLLTLSGNIEVWHLLALSLFIGCVNALDTPTRQAFYPSLVHKNELSNAIALNSAVINGSRLIGPAIGGIVIGIIGEGWCFLINGASYLGVIAALTMIHLEGFQPPNNKGNIFKDMYEGFSYIRQDKSIRTLLLAMSAFSFFGLPLVTFIPAYVKDILGGGSELLGGLMTCTSIGSFMAALYLASRKSNNGLEKFILLSGLLLGISLITIAGTHSIPLAATAFIPAGFALIAATASINSLVQELTDEDKRGRVMGYLAMTFTGISPLGSIVSGALTDRFGLPAIISISGIACTLTAIIFYKSFRPSALFALSGNQNITRP